jgi:glucose/galactose transporter
MNKQINTPPSGAGAVAPQKTGFALTVVTTVFFMWGFVTVLNDILVPHLKAVFDLNYTQIMLIQFTFFSAYFLMSIPSSRIIARFGYRKSIVSGLGVMGVGALLFYPAASVPSYGLFLTALWVLASGITLLQVAANPYVAQLGSPAKASSRLNLAQAFNSLGTTIGPYLGGLLILSDNAGRSVGAVLSPAQLQAQKLADAASVRLPYVGIAITLFLLALAISRFHLPALPDIEDSHGGRAGDSIWKHRHLVLGAVAIFVYVGAEVSIGSFLVNYFTQPNIGGLTERVAAGYVSFYWGGAMVGRFIGSAVLRRIAPGKVLGCAALVASALVWTTVATSGSAAMWSVIAVGLFNSVMFPTIFTLGIAELGPLTGKGSGLLVMAIVGGALLPVLQGALADSIGIHAAFVMPAICYLYIVFYGFSGSRVLSPSMARRA